MYISSLLNHFLFLFLIDKWYKGQEINLRIFFSNRVNYFTFFFLKPPALVSISIHFWSLWRNIYLSATDHSLHSPWGLLELADMPRIDLWWGNLRPLTIIFINLSKATSSKLKILTKNHVLIIQSSAVWTTYPFTQSKLPWCLWDLPNWHLVPALLLFPQLQWWMFGPIIRKAIWPCF